MSPRVDQLGCGNCGHEFSFIGKTRKTVSCPSCSCLLDLVESKLRGDNPSYKVSRETPQVVILEPKSHSGMYRCLECAKTFPFEADLQDPKERYTKPFCTHCGSPKSLATTPIASVVSGNTQRDPRKLKLARFVKRNFKALCEIRSATQSFSQILKRAALPKETETRLLRRIEDIHKDILDTVEAHANERLQDRMRSMGIEDVEDIF